MKKDVSRRFFMKNAGSVALLSALPASAFKGLDAANDNDLRPVLIKPGEGNKFYNQSSAFTQKLTAAHTNGVFSCTETIVNDGWLVGPPHLHQHLDEAMYVLEGTITMLTGNDIVDVSAGSWHFRPRNIIHTFWNKSGKPAKVFDFYLPGGFEEYLKKLCDLYLKYGKVDAKEVEKFIKDYDIEPHFELLGDLISKHQLKF
ncbi:MAG: cupin domain-containing protein [Chitinophagaceae bacterium]